MEYFKFLRLIIFNYKEIPKICLQEIIIKRSKWFLNIDNKYVCCLMYIFINFIDETYLEKILVKIKNI